MAKKRGCPVGQVKVGGKCVKTKQDIIASKKHVDLYRDRIDKLNFKQINIEGFATNNNEVLVLFDTPREIRHPDEYFGPYDKKPQHIKEFEEDENKLWKLDKILQAKYPKLDFTWAGDVSGSHVKKYSKS